VAFSPDGKRLASAGASKDVQVWDVGTRKELEPFTGDTRWVRFCAFSPDGKMLASVGLDKALHIWDIATRTKIADLTGHQRRIHFVTFSHDGKLAATAGMDRTVDLWDTPQGPTAKASSPGAGGQGVGGGGSAIRTVCQADVRKFCTGEEHVGRCLRRHDRELSDDCTAALRKQRENQ
jgi:WD40 repeat protein